MSWPALLPSWCVAQWVLLLSESASPLQPKVLGGAAVPRAAPALCSCKPEGPAQQGKGAGPQQVAWSFHRDMFCPSCGVGREEGADHQVLAWSWPGPGLARFSSPLWFPCQVSLSPRGLQEPSVSGTTVGSPGCGLSPTGLRFFLPSLPGTSLAGREEGPASTATWVEQVAPFSSAWVGTLTAGGL